VIENIRWLLRRRSEWQGATRGGRPVYGGPSREVWVTQRILQVKVTRDDGWIEWVDVPEVREEVEPDTAEGKGNE
jgi:hypothetical protein